MRIIDAHTHFPWDSSPGGPETGAQVRSHLESHGLSGAWMITSEGLRGEPEKHNDLIAERTRDDRDFFVPFCTVSPLKGERTCVAELERAAELGLRGLKLHPWLQAFSMTNPAVLPILRKAGDLRMPVLFHDGTPPYCTPLQIAWAAEQVPETIMILGHTGLDDLYEDAILACQRHANMYLCLCSPSAGYMREVIRRCSIEKILYGSDGGYFPHVVGPAIAKIRATGIPEERLQQIFYDNPQRLLPLGA